MRCFLRCGSQANATHLRRSIVSAFSCTQLTLTWSLQPPCNAVTFEDIDRIVVRCVEVRFGRSGAIEVGIFIFVALHDLVFLDQNFERSSYQTIP